MDKTSIIIQNLIERMAKLDKDITLKQFERKSLAIKVDKLKTMGESVELCESSGTADSKIGIFLEDFLKIGNLIYQQNDYIGYKYSTRHSDEYFKIERRVFENYVEQYAQTDLKSFLDYCIYLELIKSEKVNNKFRYIYTSGNISIYYVSKAYIDASAYVLQEAIC